jgi:hypothetical protein
VLAFIAVCDEREPEVGHDHRNAMDACRPQVPSMHGRR